MPSKVTLAVTSGPSEGHMFTFEGHDTLLFGRTKDCHIHLPKDGFVSRHHFILEVNPPAARVRDLGSLNGTIVNGLKYGGRGRDERPDDVADRQYPSCDLNHGDWIKVGNTRIHVEIVTALECSRCGVDLGEQQGRPAATDAPPLCADCQVHSTLDGAGDSQPDSDMGGLRQLLAAARQPEEDRPPEIDGYQLDRELGRGGMGVVYQARRESDRATVAIKTMLARVAANERSRKLFLREIATIQQLRHPNIVSLLDHGSAGGDFYCVMEYCNQGSLDSVLRRRNRLSLKTAAPLMIQCLNGLAHAHQQKFVHRDLKPHNILLHKRQGDVQAKVTDFGLAKSFEAAGMSGMTATGTAGGTYYYMPREQLTNFKYVHPVSDVWSLAATFYKLLTGHYPLDFPKGRDPIEVILREKATPILDRDPDIPPAVARVIDRALISNTEKRYQDASEMKVALQRALQGGRKA